MKTLPLLLSTILPSFLLTVNCWGYATILSTFDSNLEGWTVSSTSEASSTLTWQATGGNPGGYAYFQEVGASGALDAISAPAAYLGDKSGFIGGLLSYDWVTYEVHAWTQAIDVTLIGDGVTLTYDSGDPPTDTWGNMTIFLSHVAGWTNQNTGQTATMAEFASVMSDLTALNITAEYRSGGDITSFDNILLEAPEPSSYSLAIGAFCLFAIGFRRRQKKA